MPAKRTKKEVMGDIVLAKDIIGLEGLRVHQSFSIKTADKTETVLFKPGDRLVAFSYQATR